MTAAADRVRLRHMRDAARQALLFVEGERRESLDENVMLVFALVKAIEIVGEAASQISTALRETHSRIPWAVIIGMRNRLIHAYFDINLDILWETVTGNLPPLIAELEQLVPPEQDTS